MKTKSFLALVGLTIAGALCFAGAKSDSQLVVHEWGTFTSLQGGDGKLLSWVPNATAELPSFVHDWKHAEIAGLAYGVPFEKQMMFSLQRMETPVVYFYSDHEQTLDLKVKFPRGKITEWYPKAAELGPCFKPTLNRESMIHWPEVRVFPAAGNGKLAAAMPSEKSGNHYYAARETDADYLQISGQKTETEKFLFYRGVGDFKTPLLVTMESLNVVTVENTSEETVPGSFVLEINGSAGQYFPVPQLKAHEKQNVPLNGGRPIAGIKQEMARTLVAQGLYEKEAAAMVHTWEDSWFTEPGVRVLSLLPRKWTDSILGMEIKPQPRELVRVMVGRSEMLAPQTEQALTAAVAKFNAKEAGAAEGISTIMKSLGRFGDAAMWRALGRMPGDWQQHNTLLADIRKATTTQSN